MSEKTLYSDFDRFKDKAYAFYEPYTKLMLIERIAMLELQLFRLQLFREPQICDPVKMLELQLFRLQQEKEKEEENEKTKLSN